MSIGFVIPGVNSVNSHPNIMAECCVLFRALKLLLRLQDTLEGRVEREMH
jgi:hypothetical protein